MLAGAYALLVAIPADVLNALGVVAGGIGTAVFYLWGRFRKLPAAATAEPRAPPCPRPTPSWASPWSGPAPT